MQSLPRFCWDRNARLREASESGPFNSSSSKESESLTKLLLKKKKNRKSYRFVRARSQESHKLFCKATEMADFLGTSVARHAELRARLIWPDCPTSKQQRSLKRAPDELRASTPLTALQGTPGVTGGAGQTEPRQTHDFIAYLGDFPPRCRQRVAPSA